MANAPDSFYEYSVVVGDDPPKAQGGVGGESAYNSNIVTLEAVSYTHLTLPTILRV